MRTSALQWTIFGVAVCTCADMARSELIGIEPGFPTIFYDSAGTTEYDADTDSLSIDAVPLSIRFLPGAPQPIAQPASLTIRILVDEDGNLIGGAGGSDLVVVGSVGEYSGELLTGEILEFGFENTSPTDGGTDQYDLRFAITGGAFTPLYLGRHIGVTVTSEHSSFSGSFMEDFDGGAKGNIGALPCSEDDECDDDDPCTTDECVSGECVFTPIDCDDGDPCTTDECVNGVCVNTPIDCDDGDLCTTDECVNGVCVNTPIDCDDGDPCTTDECVNGVCVNTSIDCDDGDTCTTDECVNGVCVNTPIDCDDGDACTTDECVNGVCVNTPIDCDDGDPCTTDECVNGVCVNTPMDCDDGDPCTTDECFNGVCVNTPIDCDDGDPCTIDECFEGTCEHTDDPACDCELEVVVEGCIIVSPTPPAGYVCDKPIEVLTMIWDGAEPVRVKAYKGPVGSDLLADVDSIQIGDEVSISGYTGSPNDVFWEIFQSGTDNLIGLSKFHVSCSDQEMNGPEDCGHREGNGKNNDPGSINDWLLEGIVDEGGELDCTP